MTDNPQAFPGGTPSKYDGSVSNGMTLRDWFAGQALAGITADPKTGEDFDPENDSWDEWAADIAEVAYGIAAAMLAERAKVAKP